jgi:hypothetical protein
MGLHKRQCRLYDDCQAEDNERNPSLVPRRRDYRCNRRLVVKSERNKDAGKKVHWWQRAFAALVVSHF